MHNLYYTAMSARLFAFHVCPSLVIRHMICHVVGVLNLFLFHVFVPLQVLALYLYCFQFYSWMIFNTYGYIFYLILMLRL